MLKYRLGAEKSQNNAQNAEMIISKVETLILYVMLYNVTIIHRAQGNSWRTDNF